MERTCVECGKEEKLCWDKETNEYLTELIMCFNCGFWFAVWCHRDSKNSVRINGSHYWVGDKNKKGERGFAGKRFKIKFNDGREVETTNLRHNGTIPDHFLERLPDNVVSRGDTY